jgi:HlyD family secretion protein
MAIPDVLAALQASVAAVLAVQRNIFETRRQVFQSQAAVIREKRLQTLERCQKLAAIGKPGRHRLRYIGTSTVMRNAR